MAKLLLVIVGGLRANLMACAHVHCLDRLAAEGAVVRRLAPPSPLALPSLASLCTSTPPEEHGVLANSGGARVSPPAISLFSLLRYRQQSVSAFYTDDRLRVLFPTGCLQTGVLLNSQGLRNLDRQLAELAGRHLQQEQPDCCFLQLQGVEIASTHFGPRSEPCIESLEQADQSLGMILEHLTMVGIEQEYVVMVLGVPGGSGAMPAGAEAEAAMLPLILRGPGIGRGIEVTRPVSLLDLAPSMARILGIAPYPDWRGGAIDELFRPPTLELIGQDRSPQPTPRRRRRELAA